MLMDRDGFLYFENVIVPSRGVSRIILAWESIRRVISPAISSYYIPLVSH